WRGHDGPVTAVTFSPDGKHIATAGADRLIKLWDAEINLDPRERHRLGSNWERVTRPEGRAPPRHALGVGGVGCGPAGRRLAAAGEAGEVKTGDPATGGEVCSLPGHTREALALAFSPDGARLVTAGADRTVRLWDPNTGEERGTYRGHRGPVT